MENDLSIISLDRVCFGYCAGSRILDSVKLNLCRGERVALVGSNGSGKTTLLHIIMGLLKPESGHVYLFGKKRFSDRDFQEARAHIGYLFQDSDDQLFCPTVSSDVAFGPINLGKTRQEAREIMQETLAALDISHLEHRITYDLSAGEKKMVAFATIMAMRPKALLLDEPTSGLDSLVTEKIAFVLKEYFDTYIVVSHDRAFLEQTTDRTYCLEGGAFIE
ncbi:MAG: ABC transporter ATP-binding protein [Pseudomonadota bacterium]